MSGNRTEEVSSQGRPGDLGREGEEDADEERSGGGLAITEYLIHTHPFLLPSRKVWQLANVFSKLWTN